MFCKTPHEILCKSLACDALECIALTEDGSNRQYFRLIPKNSPSNTYILMQIHGQDAEDLKNDQYSWVTLSNLLSQNSIHVPKIHSFLKDYDSLIIEDFGDTTLDLYVAKAEKNQISKIYTDSYKILSKFLNVKPNISSSWSRRGFDYTLLRRELFFFKTQFLDPLNKLKDSKEENYLTNEFDMLTKEILKFPQHFTHRDFHSRNLLFHNNELGVIDFQDARWGPAAYDLCSLCFDPYVELDHQTRFVFFEKALENIASQVGASYKEEILQSWNAVLLQRMLKAIGSFAFLTKKGRRNYRIYIHPTLLILNHFIPQNSPWNYLVNELIPQLMKMSHEKIS